MKDPFVSAHKLYILGLFFTKQETMDVAVLNNNILGPGYNIMFVTESGTMSNGVMVKYLDNYNKVKVTLFGLQ